MQTTPTTISRSALQSDDPLILTDAQGNEIVDSEGTRGTN